MSGQNDWQDDTESASEYRREQAQKPGMSTGMKILLFVLCAGGVSAMLCCGGFYYMGRQAVQIDESPAATAAAAQEIAPDLQIPATFEPQARMAFKVPFTDYGMTMAAYQRSGSKGMLMLARLNIPNAGADSGEFEEQFKRGMEQGSGGKSSQRNIEIEETETRVYEINGEEVTFRFGRGTDSESGDEWRQVTGVFPSGDGFAMLMLQVAESEWDEEEILKMLATMGPEIEQPVEEAPSVEDAADDSPKNDGTPAGENSESVTDPGEPPAEKSAEEKPAEDSTEKQPVPAPEPPAKAESPEDPAN